MLYGVNSVNDKDDYKLTFKGTFLENDTDFCWTSDPYTDAIAIRNELFEKKLRQEHKDLQDAWDSYQHLLDKYKFWDAFSQNDSEDDFPF